MSWIKKNVPKDVADFLFNIKLNSLDERIGLIQRDVRPDLTVEFEHLEEQLSEAPEMLAYWDIIFAHQKAKVAVLERKAMVIAGEVTKRILESQEAQGIKLRRSDIEDLIECDEEVILVNAQIISEQRNADAVKAVVESIKTRCEVLRSLAGFKKQERSETRG